MPRMPQPPGSGAPRGGIKGIAPRPGEAVASALGTEHDLGAPITSVLALGDAFVFTTGDGDVAVTVRDMSATVVAKAHRGAILSAATAAGRLLTGGDDGRLVQTTETATVQELWASLQRRWVDQVAARPDGGTFAWTSGKTAFVNSAGAIRELGLPGAAGGLAFAPKSNRLAIGHYGGVTVWNLGTDDDTTQFYEWKGSHLETYWSPDEKYIVTAMQEGAVHGWRLSDGNDFAMRGYPGKPRSLSFSRKGEWLATSGAFEAVLWPFAGKGPMGKAPDQLARRTHMVSAVAFHPLNLYVATGYQDGVVLLARPEDRRELMVRKAGSGPVSGLAWSSDGKRLAYGCEDGCAGIVDFAAIGGSER